MNKILISLLFTSPFLLAAQNKMEKVAVNEDISISITSDFVNMSEDDRTAKFISTKVPLAMFTSKNREADLGINTNIMQWMEGEEEKLKVLYKGTFESMFDEVEYFQDDIREINGRTFIVFEFISTLREENAFSGDKLEKNYTYIQYTNYNNQVLLFNFGCKGRVANQYREVAKEMMESVKIKK